MPERRRLLFLAAAVCLTLVGGCSGGGAPPPGVPTRVRTEPLGDASQAGGGGGGLAPAAPTWTLPAGSLEQAQPEPPATVGPAAGQGQAPPAGLLAGVPAPTAAPDQVLSPDVAPPPDPAIVALLAAVQGDRAYADVRTLAGFGTRHPQAPSGSGRGPRAAADWLARRLASIAAGSAAQIMVEDEPLPGGTDQRNILASLTGIGARKRFVYAVAHRDSRGVDPADADAPAPGADDNASGVAVLLEAARVLSGRQWDATIRLMALDGAEQGARGATHHAEQARRIQLPIEAVLSLDRVGQAGSGGPAAYVFASGSGDDASRRLARTMDMVARRYGLGGLTVASSAERPGGEGDHLAFARAGFPSARITDAAGDESPAHGPADSAATVRAQALAGSAQLAVALLANLALAPPAPTSAPEVGLVAKRPDTVRVRWPATADSAVAGYWVGVRTADAQTYDPVTWVGGRTDTVISGLPADGPLRVAVASADALGHASLFGPEAER